MENGDCPTIFFEAELRKLISPHTVPSVSECRIGIGTVGSGWPCWNSINMFFLYIGFCHAMVVFVICMLNDVFVISMPIEKTDQSYTADFKNLGWNLWSLMVVVYSQDSFGLRGCFLQIVRVGVLAPMLPARWLPEDSLFHYLVEQAMLQKVLQATSLGFWGSP